MLIYFTSRLVSCVVAFLYPGYASFKTLSQRPASEEDLERWLMYWSVLACVIGIEYLAEWLVSWIPFYYFVKMIFLLYLALPQTRGASYLYQTHLAPLLRTHEPQIDAALAQLKARLLAFLHTRARALWDAVVASATSPPPPAAAEASAGGPGAPPALSDPVSGPTQMLGTLWRTYGPVLVAGGTALLQRQGVPAAPAPAPAQGYDVDAPAPSRTPSSGERSPALGAGLGSPEARFEEVEVPSDAEGPAPPPAPRRASSGGWFGWGAAAQPHAKMD
ncbi:TB2/DP1, HVA22 family-domain-containing protein [Gloeopeniophorella convolvens]|nr:TB2/DP1, HVA22 family-domain-containing protein [Gloeopeniophorella convolvens]